MNDSRTSSFDGGIPVKGAARVEAAGAMRIADAAKARVSGQSNCFPEGRTTVRRPSG